jgi:predicted aspartyl protease
MVDVRINGHGPYHFVVDTGADRTILASEVAVELRLSHGEEVMLSIDYGLQESSPPKPLITMVD